MKYKFFKKQGVLKCYAYSVKNSDIEEKIKNKEKYGIEDDKIYGQPIEMVLDFDLLEGVMFFTPNKVELYEEGNFEEGVHVEFGKDVDMVLLIDFETFQNIYYDYKGITDGD